MAASNTPYLEVNELYKHYGEGEAKVAVLRGISTRIEKGQICVLLGPSGSGKSTTAKPDAYKFDRHPNGWRSLF